MLKWLYNAWFTLVEWGQGIYDFMTAPVADVLFTDSPAKKVFDYLGVEWLRGPSNFELWLASLLPDVTVFELLIGGGTVAVLVYILVSWVLDLLP